MSSANQNSVSVIFTSDFICPWCFIAERRLGKVAQDLGINLQITYQPYELNPDMPKVGISRKAYRTRKFGSWEYSCQLDAATIQAAQNDPLTLNYERIEFTPNSRSAHRLIQYVQQRSPEILAALASEVGLDPNEVLAFLQSKEGEEEVVRLEQQAVRGGIQGVPSIQIGGEVISGAASAEVMEEMLQRAVIAVSRANNEGC